MARVLISAIGTGRTKNEGNETKSTRKYESASYRFDEKTGQYKEYSTPFIAAALAEHLRVDRVVLLGTAKSMWEGVYEYFADESEPDYFETWDDLSNAVTGSSHDEERITPLQLELVSEAIDKYLKQVRSTAVGGSRCLLIKYGINHDELLQNLNIFMGLVDHLGQDDEIYLDITHAFRSIPLFLFAMLDFMQTLEQSKRVQVSGIYYGMLEARRDLGYAPVVDLKFLFDLVQWAKGVYEFINYGSSYLIAEKLPDHDLSVKIKEVSDLINLGYLPKLRQTVDSLGYHLEKKDAEEIPVFRYLMPHMRQFVETFKGANSKAEFQFRLAKWYRDNRRYGSAVVCLAEAIVTRLFEIYRDCGRNLPDNLNSRDKIKYLIKDRIKAESPDSVCYKLSEIYNEIADVRNSVAHAGFKEAKVNILKFPNRCHRRYIIDPGTTERK